MRIERTIDVEAPPEEVWALVADPATYPRHFSWFAACDPADPDGAPGVGSRYELRVHAGSTEVGGVIEVIEYAAGRDVVWTSVTGLDQRGRIRVRAAGPQRTTVTMRISYGAPGALLGTLAELVAGPQVNRRLQQTLEQLKALAEHDRPPADGALATARGLPGRLLHEVENVGVLVRSGLVAPMRPDKIARIALAAAQWGASPAAGVVIGAIRHPDRAFIADELGELTYREVDRRTNALAHALADEGLECGDRIGLLCRDHRGFVETTLAAAKLGADVLLLNTSFAGPQLTEVCRREQAAAIVHDAEFTALVAEAGRGRIRFIAWPADPDDDGPAPDLTTLEELIGEGDPGPVRVPARTGRVTILTSGTTGTPKGATRGDVPRTLDPAAALLERIPLREGMTVRLAAPLFHAWGFSNLVLGMALGATLVLRRRFDPEQTLRDVERHRAYALVVVPVMLQRILALGAEVHDEVDTTSLRAVCASGAALPGDLATRWMDAFGDHLYNLYGSTEVASATIATPADMRAAPGTAGRPARGTVIELFDPDGRAVAQGTTGRIFVGNAMLFEGYTGGADKERIGGLMSTGDVGRFDESGRLHVEGRDDEMIVSGGENVFPKEVEDVLARHPAVAEAAAIGVPDEEFGQRLRAFVVVRAGEKTTAGQLQRHVKATLARYKVPREVVFLDALPRTSTGKVLKRELADRV